jgi:nucleoside-diphosphate-sugar epimerase
MAVPTILVTGVSGYIATHVAKCLISHGYHVRGTVRNPETAEKVRQTFSETPSSIETVIVPDIAKEGSFNEAVRDVDGVIHTASPFFYKVSDFDKDMCEPAVNGTLELLKSVKAMNPNVERVVITSSFAAIHDFSKGRRPGYVYTENDWNPVSLDMAYKFPSLRYAWVLPRP